MAPKSLQGIMRSGNTKDLKMNVKYGREDVISKLLAYKVCSRKQKAMSSLKNIHKATGRSTNG